MKMWRASIVLLMAIANWSMAESSYVYNPLETTDVTRNEIVKCLLHCQRQVPDDAAATSTPLIGGIKTNCACLALIRMALSGGDWPIEQEAVRPRLHVAPPRSIQYQGLRQLGTSAVRSRSAFDMDKRIRWGLGDDVRESGKGKVELWQDDSPRKAFRYG